ncbi:MAG: glycosyltransferase family 39 protein, partial [Muribaculaceae bacterium]|nr:glycosyltransferase family 39 protein [Muribaculaceae bacterium]
IVVIIAALILLPWGSRTHFNTKGEPREAIVAVSMLNSDNWVLPESYGHDIPYKPPMLAWCIAGASVLLNGGHVSEFTSRLPSALAAMALVILTFNWVARRRDTVTASLTALVTLTAFEVFRNAAICRVDMLLTFFIAGSIFYLDTEGFSRKRQAVRIIIAIVLMGCATLTKGPIGALLPCLVTGVYRLLRRHNFFATFLKLTGYAVAAIGIAAIWYYAAYLQGGEDFLELAKEENIGRLTGTMTYDSHLNPWWYNIICVIYGMLPYTILALAALIPLSRRSRHDRPLENARRHTGIFSSRLNADSLLALCAAVLTIGFYCIPSSKRSSYLLPAYPFMAFGIVLLYNRLTEMRSSVPKGYARFIGALAMSVTVIVIALRCG